VKSPTRRRQFLQPFLLGFDGEDPETWCGQATQFFDYYGTSDHQRFSICSYHMYSKARVWFRELNATQGVSRWDELVKAIKARFSVPEEVDNEEKFKKGAEEKKGDEEEKRDEILPEIDPNEAPKYTIFSETDPKHTITATPPFWDIRETRTKR
jgi:hypothetical protein